MLLVSKIPYCDESRMNASIIGSNVVKFTRHLLGVIVMPTPKICKVFSSVVLPGWLVIMVIGSKKSRLRAATIPVL